MGGYRIAGIERRPIVQIAAIFGELVGKARADRGNDTADDDQARAHEPAQRRRQQRIGRVEECLGRQRPHQTGGVAIGLARGSIAEHPEPPRLRERQIKRDRPHIIDLAVDGPERFDRGDDEHQQKQRIKARESRHEERANPARQRYRRPVIVVNHESAQHEKQRHADIGETDERRIISGNARILLEQQNVKVAVRKQNGAGGDETQPVE